METVPASIAAGTPRGISNTLTGFVIENETITKSDISEQVADQMGAIANEISYDKRTDLRLIVRSATANTTTPATEGTILTYNSIKYHVESVEEAGTYNGLRRWTISAHRFTNWPT